jgi:anti-sigma B factor antagonist
MPLSDCGGVELTPELFTAAESLAITVDHDQDRAFVRLDGHIGPDSSPDLRDRLLAILQGQLPTTITVDLADVSHIDASGIATLLEALKIARSRQITFCLKGLQGRMSRLFEVTGLQAVFETACKADPRS